MLIGRITTPRFEGIRAPLNLGGNLAAREATSRHWPIMNTSRNFIATLTNPGARARLLELELNHTTGKQVRPNPIPPFAALIHLNTLGLPENADSRTARRIPHFLRVFRTRRK